MLICVIDKYLWRGDGFGGGQGGGGRVRQLNPSVMWMSGHVTIIFQA